MCQAGIRVNNKVGTIMIFRVRAKVGIRVSDKVGTIMIFWVAWQGGN